MKTITHNDYLSLRRFKEVHINCMEIGEKVRDGASYILNKDDGCYLEGVRTGYVIERISDEDFKLHKPTITGVPESVEDEQWMNSPPVGKEIL